jgi:hypothetical protein
MRRINPDRPTTTTERTRAHRQRERAELERLRAEVVGLREFVSELLVDFSTNSAERAKARHLGLDE